MLLMPNEADSSTFWPQKGALRVCAGVFILSVRVSLFFLDQGDLTICSTRIYPHFVPEFTPFFSMDFKHLKDLAVPLSGGAATPCCPRCICGAGLPPRRAEPTVFRGHRLRCERGEV
jgi:hypothetical protein